MFVIVYQKLIIKMISYKRKYLLIKYLLFVSLLISNKTFPQFSSTRFEQYNIINGLSNNSVNCILQTKDGYLWIATKDGLNRFDGKSFKVFKNNPIKTNSLPENYVMSLFESRNGTLWVGTWGGGLCKYDPIYETFNTIKPRMRNDNYVQNIVEDSKGNIWFGTLDGGIFKYNLQNNTLINFNSTSESKIILPNDNVTFIIVNDDDSIWFATWGSGLGYLNEKSKKIINFFHQPDKNSLSNNNIWNINKYGKDKILVSTDFGFDLFDIKTKKFFHNLSVDNKYNSILNTPIRQTFIDNKGQIWIGTYEYQGIFLVKNNNGKFEIISHIQKEEDNPFSLSMNRIRWIYQDNNFNMWFGTEDGLNLLHTQNYFERFEFFKDRKNSLGGKVVSGIISEGDSILWVSYAGSGFDKIDLINKKINHFTNIPNNNNSLSENDVTTIYKDKNNIFWIGTAHSGLNKYHIKLNKMERIYFDNSYKYQNDLNWIQQILELKNGELLVGTNGGLFLFDRKKSHLVNYNPVINGKNIFPDYFSVNSLFEDKQENLWVGTWLEGLYFYNKRKSKSLHYLNLGDSNSISSNKVTCITEDKDGLIWIGTYNGGLNIINTRDNKIKIMSTKDGLPNDVVLGIIEDENGYMWVSTLNGLCRIDRDKKRIRIFNRSDGIVNNQFNWHASFKSSNGKIYFGTLNGFIAFYPKDIKVNLIKPKIVFTSFKVMGIEKKLSKSLESIKEVILNHDQNFFSIDYSVLDISSANNFSFKYKLDGIDNDWVDAGYRTSVFYTDIDPGEYKFFVKASNADGIIGNPVSFKIIILPAWWMTLWFKLLIIFLALFIGVTVYKLRIKRLTKLQKLRMNIANDLHDEIGSNLSSISVNSQILLNSDNLNITEKEILSNMANTTKETIQTMRDIIWFINPNNDFETDLIIKLKETASKLLININWEFNVFNDINFKRFNLEERRNLFLIYKETLNNIVKHAKAKNCSISFSVEREFLVLQITDDGIGFDTNNTKSNDGLKSIYRRAKKLSAELKIISTNGEGTTVNLKIPINKKNLFFYFRKNKN